MHVLSFEDMRVLLRDVPSMAPLCWLRQTTAGTSVYRRSTARMHVKCIRDDSVSP